MEAAGALGTPAESLNCTSGTFGHDRHGGELVVFGGSQWHAAARHGYLTSNAITPRGVPRRFSITMATGVDRWVSVRVTSVIWERLGLRRQVCRAQSRGVAKRSTHAATGPPHGRRTFPCGSPRWTCVSRFFPATHSGPPVTWCRLPTRRGASVSPCSANGAERPLHLQPQHSGCCPSFWAYCSSPCKVLVQHAVHAVARLRTTNRNGGSGGFCGSWLAAH